MEAEATRATEAHAAKQAQINNKNLVELKPLTERLNELVADKQRLAHFTTGASYTNELGLVVPASAPL